LRKNIGAKSPQELKLDSSSPEGRCLYLQHIVECACTLLDTGYCRVRPCYGRSDNHKYKVMCTISDVLLTKCWGRLQQNLSST
jgi:hypothetical protein